MLFCFFFKQKTAYDMRISDWSSDVCSSDLVYFPALEPLLDAGKGLIDVIEVEPQPLWLKDSGGGCPRLDERAFDRLLARPQRKLVHGVGIPLAGTVEIGRAHV